MSKINVFLKQTVLRLIPDKYYIKMMFLFKEHKILNLKNPRTFDEKLQWLKLYDRKPLYTTLVDKYKVKDWVANKIGKQYVIPLIGVWNEFDEIDFDKLPNKFVLKTTQGSGDIIVCKDKSKFDKERARKIINNSMKSNYYYLSREWPYKNVEKKVIVEEYIELGDVNDHYDYKFICCDGKVKALFLDIGVIDQSTGGHSEQYYRNVYNDKFELMPYLETRQNSPFKIEKPKNFDKMIELANKLSEGIPQVRVDMYNVDGKIYFGEMTFYHGGGFGNKFIPESGALVFGDMIKLPKRKA